MEERSSTFDTLEAHLLDGHLTIKTPQGVITGEVKPKPKATLTAIIKEGDYTRRPFPIYDEVVGYTIDIHIEMAPGPNGDVITLTTHEAAADE